MEKKLVFLILTACFSLCNAFAAYNPTAYYTVDGETMETTDAIMDAQAPLEVTFKANPDEDNPTVGYEWRFRRSEEQQPFMTRHEETTVFTFSESGQTIVELYITENGVTDEVPIATITVSISNSFLDMPNAFSPNGDGVNDVFTIHNLVEGQAFPDNELSIYNRYGKRIYFVQDIRNDSDFWDPAATNTPSGTYFYRFVGRGPIRDVEFKGSVEIIR